MPRTKLLKIGIAATGTAVAAIFFFTRHSIDSDATKFLSAVVEKRWAEAFSYAGAEERQTLGWDEPTFSTFCDTLTQYGWPVDDRIAIEEMTPASNHPSSSEIGTDTSWDQAGKHRYKVTFWRKKDNTCDLYITLDYRHSRAGDWNPDVLSTVLAVSRAVPGGKPAKGVYEALKAAKRDSVTLYPFGQTAKLSDAADFLSGKSKRWLWSKRQELH